MSECRHEPRAVLGTLDRREGVWGTSLHVTRCVRLHGEGDQGEDGVSDPDVLPRLPLPPASPLSCSPQHLPARREWKALGITEPLPRSGSGLLWSGCHKTSTTAKPGTLSLKVHGRGTGPVKSSPSLPAPTKHQPLPAAQSL